MLRHAAVAGHFYPGTADALRRQVREFIVSAERVRALGILSPHAGFVYSGAVAGAVYSSIILPDTFVLIGPNHTGLGAPVSIMCDGAWETPLGPVDIDIPLARSILSRSPRIHEDSLAHVREHSLEVQLPFIQYFKEHVTIVPIQVLDARLETCLELGRAVAEAIKEGMKDEERGTREKNNSEPRTPNNVLIIASSDMSHYEPAVSAKEKDFKALHDILSLDPEGLYATVKKHDITMCGFAPAVAMLTACKILGASETKLVKYANSGEVSGDYEQVVGYAGVIVM